MDGFSIVQWQDQLRQRLAQLWYRDDRLSTSIQIGDCHDLELVDSVAAAYRELNIRKETKVSHVIEPRLTSNSWDKVRVRVIFMPELLCDNQE